MHGKPPSQEWGNRGGQQRFQSQAHMTEQMNQNEEKEKGGLNIEEIEKFRGLIGLLVRVHWYSQVSHHSLLDYMSQKSV